MPRGSSTTRPPTTGPSTETVAPHNGDSTPDELFVEKLGSVDEHALPELDAARNAVNSAVDDMTAQFVQDGTVSRVGVAQLRDAIDELRQAIPRQRKRRTAGGDAGDE